MSLAQYKPNDTPPTIEGDTGFFGLNMKLEPFMLAQGLLSESQNKRLRRGIAETRPGVVEPVPFNAINWETIYGDGIYREQDTESEWMLIATPAGIYRMADGVYPQPIELPAGETVTGPCEFVQALGQVLLFRGVDQTPLQWDGGRFIGFQLIDQSVDGTGIDPIPNASTAELFANRLLVPVGRDGVGASDIFDFTRYDSILNQFKIQSGTNEKLVRIFPYSQATVVMFKDRSTYALENVSGDLTGVRLVTISRTIGCCAAKSVAMVGADAFWLSASPPGVYRLQQIIQERLQTSAIPVSDAIEPLIRRINWAHASRACAVLFEEYYYLAVPLDDSTVNNAILVYNTIGGPNAAGAWESVDFFAADVDIASFQVTAYQGRQRLFGIDHTHGRVLLFGEGKTDRIGGDEQPIADRITTRGYTMGGVVSIKDFNRVHVSLGTWHPTYSLSVSTDGVGESALLVEDKTRSRSASLVFGAPDADATNANNDHATRGREDYSVACPFQVGSGIRLNRVQEILERWPIRQTGRFITITMESNGGSADVRSVAIESAETERVTRAQT